MQYSIHSNAIFIRLLMWYSSRFFVIFFTLLIESFYFYGGKHVSTHATRCLYVCNWGNTSSNQFTSIPWYKGIWISAFMVSLTIYFTLILCLLYFVSGHWPCFCLFGSHSWIFCIIFWKARYALFTWLNCWGGAPYFSREYWLFTNITEQLNIYSLWCLLLKDNLLLHFFFL